jgi:glycosyltransferase involved in cell wall biosynthesis
MRIVYANAGYSNNSAEGGPAHMRQFIENASALGHEIFLWHGMEQHSLTKPVPGKRLDRLKLFRSADLIYYRIEWRLPKGCRVILPPYRKLIGNPLVVWEFNTVPEYGRMHGDDDAKVQWWVNQLRRYAHAVDLATCVSNKIADYVRDHLGFRRVITIPNGSDPQLFRPDVPRVKRIEKKPGRMDVVWIGSANLAWHNFDLLVKAAWSIWNSGQGDQIVFHVIGQGMKGLRDAPPNLNYYGPEEYRHLPGWLSAMDVGLNVYHPGPADYSSPLKLFDYMASGLTVVSTEQPQAHEIFEQLGQADLLIPHDQPGMLADALRRLAADPDYRKRQGAAGRQLIIDRYNWRKSVTDTFAEIEKLRGRHLK